MALGTFDRDRALQELGDHPFDVLVVGGGVTGCGIALDAASRGLRTALVEREDFASGTSSKSSKMVHGGLRYLQNGDVRLVYEALRERQRLRRNAPHLVDVLPFLIPIFAKDGLINAKVARALGSAMWMYDLTGGARIGKLHKRLSKEEAVAHMPTLPVERLAGGYLYYDAGADDARLTLALARTAALDHGAVVANHASVVQLRHDDRGRCRGAVVEADGRRIEVSAAVVVNAAGVWADEVRGLDEGEPPDTIRPAKGVHITVPWELVRNDIAVVVPVPKDKRSVFVVPWLPRGDGTYELTYIGTTDTDYDGPLDDPQCTPEDVAYLLRAINGSVAEPLSEADVVGTWAGLRPLVKAATTGRTADLSRQHKVEVSDSGVVTITGGKLTTYREMAEDTLRVVVGRLDELPRRARRCRTRSLPLRGADAPAPADDADGLLRHLHGRYGAEARVLLALIEADPGLGEALVPGLPYVRAEALHAVRHEMARSVDDVLARRTRARLQARDASADAADDVARLIAPELGWTPEEAAAQAARYRDLVQAERSAAGLPGRAGLPH
ncbi:MAG: glycerol-3-phosphate dehydrogenase/oxidase [Acidimicrobiia bacterium]|jgi:glycerol-3-phosphate dehydrogenase